MFKKIVYALFGSPNDRVIKKLYPVIDQVNAFESQISALSDEALKAKTQEFRDRIKQGQKLDDIYPEVFACVREASKRTIGLRHFDTQLMGGYVLHTGRIAEMRTGEGKTLVATLAAYLNALEGKGVHIVTVNDYLANRDRAWMGPVFEFLGLSVDCVEHDMRATRRRAAYASDITYVTNNELGFDYLRDNMVVTLDEKVLRELNYAIVDEVDSILIDEARTPLIISGPAEESTDKYYICNRLVPMLKGRKITESEEIDAKYKGIELGVGFDYIVDEKNHTVVMTDQGVTKAEKLLGVKNIYDDIQAEWVHHLTQAIRAHNLYQKDVQYVLKDGEVIIVDEFTGRLMPGRRWSEGLHQAVEAKENMRIAEENQTLATITFQNFFKMYKKISGMTGTAVTEAQEFWQIYKLAVVEVPTNKKMIRRDHADIIYRTEREKYEAVVCEIENLWKKGQPVLVGTRSIEKSERVSAILRRKGIPHQVLNAKYHEMEAQIISQAGKKGSVTIATNMAGRGTDIVLGGTPPVEGESQEVIALGGLHILGTERHESRRIDNQLRGRSGRQGDPGSSRFYLSLEDELMRLFGSERISTVMQKLGMKDGEDIQHPWISKAIENAQKKVEGMNFDIRKQLLEYDNVMNKQREVVYRLRASILAGEDISSTVAVMLEEAIDEKINQWAPAKQYPEQWEWLNLETWLTKTFNCKLALAHDEMLQLRQEGLKALVQEKINTNYTLRTNLVSAEQFNEVQRRILLMIIDTAWKEHLYDLDQVKKGIGLRAYGNKDPLIEYQKESFEMFEQMMCRIREASLEYIFNVELVQESAPVQVAKSDENLQHPKEKNNLGILSQNSQKVDLKDKLGRNDPCPCGSGKKYKKCCGK